MSLSIVALMLKTEYDTIDDIEPEFFASFLAERISENKFPIDKDRIYKEIRIYMKKRHQSNPKLYIEDYEDELIPSNFNYNNLNKNTDLANFALQLIEDGIFKDIEKSILYDDIAKEFNEIIYGSMYTPYIANGLNHQINLSYRSFINQVIKEISIEKLSLNQVRIEKEIDTFLEIMNDTDPSTKIEIIRHISKLMPSNFRKEKFDIMFNLKQYDNLEENSEFSLKLL